MIKLADKNNNNLTHDLSFTINFADCDKNYYMKPQILGNWAGELAGLHLRTRNITRNLMWSKGQVFLMTKSAVKFFLMPRYLDKLTLRTWEGGTKGAQFIRRFQLFNGVGKVLCDMETMWVLVNPHTHQLVRPKEFAYKLFPLDTTTTAKIQKFKAANPEKIRDYTFTYSDIDANCHVNNGVYLRLMIDILPDIYLEKAIASYQINYIKECVQGDVIELYLEKADDSFIVEGRFPDGSLSFEAIISF